MRHKNGTKPVHKIKLLIFQWIKNTPLIMQSFVRQGPVLCASRPSNVLLIALRCPEITTKPPLFSLASPLIVIPLQPYSASMSAPWRKQSQRASHCHA
jgi:hypothetical protein